MKALPYVSSVVLTDRKQDEGAVRTLYTVSTDYDYRSKEELELEHGIPGAFPDYQVTVCSDDTMGMEIPVYIFVIAGIILIFVLLILSASLVEPFLFLLVIGGAILLNMGTNLILGSVSQTTWSISAVLQLVLSMDYSIILMNRYRQEKEAGSLPEEAMERALKRASSSIASSSFTTFVGLLMLVFMRFRIGKDIGLVLAKGVFLSMLCCIIVLPGNALCIFRLKRWLLSGIAAGMYLRSALSFCFSAPGIWRASPGFPILWIKKIRSPKSFRRKILSLSCTQTARKNRPHFLRKRLKRIQE